MAAEKTSWHCLPAEIRGMILQVLLQDGCSLANFATVSREWQTVIEQHTFARIKLTPSRLAEFASRFPHRNRASVGYIWFCLELEEYDCAACAPDLDDWGMNESDSILVATAFSDLFSALSTWEPHGKLLLDIGIHSPSDSKHWFKYLTFGPDTPPSDARDRDQRDRDGSTEQPTLPGVDDSQHSWINGRRGSAAGRGACEKVFEEIMGEGPFTDDEQENVWWDQLPLVLVVIVVTGLLLRQQTRRRWKPAALVHMVSRFPNLQEVHYEPWMEWIDVLQEWTDQCKYHSFVVLRSSGIYLLISVTSYSVPIPS